MPKSAATNSIKLQPRQVIGVAMGYLALFFASQSVMVLALPFYQMTLAVDPLLLAFALTLPMLLGTALSPWLGAYSDQFRSRFGRRRPFLLLGTLLCAASFAAIWQVPPTWPMAWQLGYFASLCLVFFAALPLMAVPLSSLVFEQTDDEQQRTLLFGVTSAVQKIGALGYQWLVPFSQMAVFGSLVNGVRSVGLLVATLLIALPGLLATSLSKEKPLNFAENNQEQPTQTSTRLSHSFRRLYQPGPLPWLFAICFLQLGGCAWVAGADYYLLVYSMFAGDIVAGSWWKAILSTSYALVGLLSVPVLAKLSQRFGIWRVLVGVFSLNALGGLAKWLLFTPDIGYWLLLDALLCSPAWTAMVMLIPPLLTKTSSERKSNEANQKEVGCQKDAGQHESSAYGEVSGLYHWVVSGSGAIAMLLAGATLNWSGFSAALGGAQSEQTLMLLRLVLAGGTFACSLGILLLLVRLRCYPSFRSVHDGHY
jgi:Na+/melibiose symporter-like transporter